MDISKYKKMAGLAWSQAKLFTRQHSPAILTGIGIAGFAAAIPLAISCKRKSDQLHMEAESEKRAKEDVSIDDAEEIALNKKEKVIIFAKAYWPVGATFAVSTACVILGLRGQMKRTEAVESALVIAQKELYSQRKAIEEELSKTQAQKIIDGAKQDSAQDIISKSDTDSVEKTGYGNTLCVDLWSGRMFRSDIESIRRAFNDLNAQMIESSDYFTPVNDLYFFLGLEPCDVGRYMGWSYPTDYEKIYPNFTSGINETTGEPYLAYDFTIRPEYEFDK